MSIRFFELIDEAEERRIRSINWDRQLGTVDGNRIGLVQHGRRSLDGTIYGGARHRVLSVAVDRDMAARQRQTGTGVRKSMVTDGDDWQPSEESFAVFFDRNVFGLLRISPAAPTHSAVAKWLNRAIPWVDNRGVSRFYKAVPVVDPNIMRRIRESGGQITSADFAFEPQELPTQSPSLILDLGRQVRGHYDEGAVMEVSVRAGRKRGSDSNRAQLDWDTMEVLDAEREHGFLRRGRGTYKPAGGGPQQPFDLLGEKLAIKSEVHIPDNDPEGFELATNAAAAIRAAYGEARDQILSLVQPAT